ncbi:MAG: SDR family oxidoreductase [Desulfobacteraceae bacterium]|jgi:AcrR family transcriptional regulator/NAD(P)-dependent dehydrogenase (short-subunit alcohol dehydrogenase family)
MKKTDLTKSIPTHIKSEELVEKRRQQIVLAAIKLFSRKGFVKTTLKDLAEEAGLSYGNIYDYVGNKEDIFVLVHEFLTGEADQGLNRVMESIDDPLDKLKGMIHNEFELSARWSDAILFVYQDIHVLKRQLLKKLLSKESEHVRKFKDVLDKCIEKGYIKNCNTHIISNLIKAMIDAWVIKRWDLDGVTQYQIEKAILNLFLDGLRTKKSIKKRSRDGEPEFEGKTILIVNGGSIFGSALSSFMYSRGASLAIYDPCDEMTNHLRSSLSPEQEGYGEIKTYSLEEYGPMTQRLLLQIQRECGPIDIFIQDIGVTGGYIGSQDKRKALLNKQLVENLHMARSISSIFIRDKDNIKPEKILYITPWAWDKYIDSILYETVKASTIALAKANSERMRESGGTVNCLVPGHIGGIRDLSVLDDGASQSVVASILKCESLGDVSDIVKTAAYLVSDSARYVTGQVITVDGGMP